MNVPSKPHDSLSDSSDLVTAELYALFVEAKTRAGRSRNTLITYEYGVRPFVEKWPMLPLEPEVLEQYLASWNCRADATISQVCRSLGTFYGWLVIRGHIDIRDNPFLRIDRPTVRKKLPRFLTMDELRRVVAVTKAPYERALLLTLIDTGARIGELTGRTKDHIRGELLLVDGKEGERMVPLSPEVRGYLQSLPTRHLFPSRKPDAHARMTLEAVDVPLTTSGANQAVRAVLRRAGVTGLKSGPHVIRHSFGVHFLAQGGDLVTLARILGHSSISMSERYAALSMDQISAKHRQYSTLRGLMSMTPAIPVEELPEVILPGKCYPPNLPDDVPVTLRLRQHRGKKDGVLRYYITAWNDDGKYPTIATLEPELPLSVVDGYRLAIHRENQRRLALNHGVGPRPWLGPEGLWPGPPPSRPGPGREPEIVTMCSHCRKLKNDAGEWVDSSALAELPDEDNISHGICPPCIRANYPPALADRVLSRQRDES